MAQFSKARFERVRWSIFGIMALTYILVYFHRMAPAVLAGGLMAAFNTSGAALGSLAAVYFFVYAAMQIPSGVLADVLGPRIVLTAGSLTAGVGSILFGLAGSFAQAYLGRFLVGLGVSVVFISILKNNAEWFSERRYALMSGVTAFIGNLGSVCAAGPLAALLLVLSWRSIFLGIGILSLVLAAASFLFIRNRPEDAGFPPLSEMEGERPIAPSAGNWMRELWSVLRVHGIWTGFWYNFGMTGGLFAFMGLWGIPFLRDSYSLSRNESSLYMTVMLLAFAFGVLISGWLSDRIGRRKPVLVGNAVFYLLSWAALLYLPWTPGPSGFLLFLLTGFFGGGGIVTYASAKEITNPSLSGMATSLVNTGGFVATVFTQPFIGWTLDHLWTGALRDGARIYTAHDFHIALFLMVALAAVSILAALRVRETYCRNISCPENDAAPSGSGK